MYLSNVLNWIFFRKVKLLETNLYNIHNKSITPRNECTVSIVLKSIEWIHNYVKSYFLMNETLDKKKPAYFYIAGRFVQVVAHCPWTVLLYLSMFMEQ